MQKFSQAANRPRASENSNCGHPSIALPFGNEARNRAHRSGRRSDLSRVIAGDHVILVDEFSDFREVDGLVFPHLIETYVENRPETIRIVVESVELNPDLDDARFRFPR